MAFLGESFLDKFRTDYARRIKKLQYYNGETWHDAQITNKTIEGDTIKITAQATDGEAMTITRVKMIDIDDETIGEIAENITKGSGEGLLLLWQFPIYEVTT